MKGKTRQQIQAERSRLSQATKDYLEHLGTMHDVCEARGLHFRIEMRDLVRGWLQVHAPAEVPVDVRLDIGYGPGFGDAKPKRIDDTLLFGGESD